MEARLCFRRAGFTRFDCGKIKALGWKARRTSAEAVTDAMKAMCEELTHA